jgi:hypothetical protein
VGTLDAIWRIVRAFFGGLPGDRHARQLVGNYAICANEIDAMPCPIEPWRCVPTNPRSFSVNSACIHTTLAVDHAKNNSHNSQNGWPNYRLSGNKGGLSTRQQLANCANTLGQAQSRIPPAGERGRREAAGSSRFQRFSNQVPRFLAGLRTAFARAGPEDRGSRMWTCQN